MKRGFQERVSRGMKMGLSAADASVLAKLSTPEKIQDFISSLAVNLEKEGDTCLSVSKVLKHGHAHCIESAFTAGVALWMGGSPPLLMDLRAIESDCDHVVALFRSNGCWGAISKTNHVWLRWRDPVYRTLRELAMSYFHEYVDKGKKTLRAYSASFDLRRFPAPQWVTNEDHCWDIAEALDSSRHYNLLTPAQSRTLKPRDPLEIEAGTMVEYAT